ncbi:MAG: Rpn family recombination-promoting nuclease/putative transposase [Chloroflexaceae bacterium]
MSKPADRGSKKLISLAPDAWAQWVTQRPDVVARVVAGAEFTWLSRASDAVILAHAPDVDDFVIVNEVQLRYTQPMPRRIAAYAALAEEHYNLPVYPVLINILPPAATVTVADRYESSFMGMQARRDYRVINLWEVDVSVVFAQPIPPLLPFVPILQGGGNEAMVRRALHELRADAQLHDLESLLAFFASFVLKSELIQQIMRWDMIVLEESPWYQEIIKRGEQRGEQRERVRTLLRILHKRFPTVPPDLPDRLAGLDMRTLDDLMDTAITTPSLDEFMQAVAQHTAPAPSDNGE